MGGEGVPPGDLDAKLIPTRVAAVGVTLYNNGVIGCSVSSRKNLDEAIVAAATGAAKDRRFMVLTPELASKICPAVSILYDPERIGNTARDKAARKLRLGRDSLEVQQGEHRSVFLESVGPHYDWNKEEEADPTSPAKGTRDRRTRRLDYLSDRHVAVHPGRG